MKPLFWVASATKDLVEMPDAVIDVMGYALYLAQNGLKHRQSKALKGFGSATVMEIVEEYEGNTYRAIYTVKFTNGIYVLHCFQKKSRRNSETSKGDMEIVFSRLTMARLHSEGASK